MRYNNAGLPEQIKCLAEGCETACSLAEKALVKADQLKELNAFVVLNRETIMAQAEASDARRREKRCLSILDGVPIAVKDNYLTRDFPTTACSFALPEISPNEDATIVESLRNAGVVIFGKTNMHEWAYGATNSVSSYGITSNPHNRLHITGGE